MWYKRYQYRTTGLLILTLGMLELDAIRHGVALGSLPQVVAQDACRSLCIPLLIGSLRFAIAKVPQAERLVRIDADPR